MSYIKRLKDYLGISKEEELSLQDKLKNGIYEGNKYGAYIAGPFFSKEQLKNNEKICKLVESYGIETFLPKRDAGEATTGPLTLDYAKELFNSDLRGLDNSMIIIADITDYGKGRDVGTAVEIGYMASLGKPVVILDFSKNKKSNIMLAGIAQSYIRNFTELQDWLEGETIMHISDEELE